MKTNDNEYITDKQLDSACKRQERKNLNKKGRSTSWVSMFNYIREYMLEYQIDNKLWLMKKGWRKAIKQID